MNEAEEAQLAKEYREREYEELLSIHEHNDRIMKAIRSTKGEEFEESVADCIEESEANDWYQMELVKEPTGEHQEDDNIPEGVWVLQWSVGDSGDSWEGYVCIKLKEKMYLKFRYSM